MRYTPILLASLALTAQAAQAAPELNISVIHGQAEPSTYRFDLNEQRREIDIRERHRYNAAFHVPKTNEDICRDGEYKTGLMFTAKYVPSAKDNTADVQYPIELIGQISSLKDSKPGIELSCGRNTEIEMINRAVSDTVFVKPNRPKGVVIDNDWTIILTVKP
jgi:hypothetical protein